MDIIVFQMGMVQSIKITHHRQTTLINSLVIISQDFKGTLDMPLVLAARMSTVDHLLGSLKPMAESYTTPAREKQGAFVSLSISRLNID